MTPTRYPQLREPGVLAPGWREVQGGRMLGAWGVSLTPSRSPRSRCLEAWRGGMELPVHLGCSPLLPSPLGERPPRSLQPGQQPMTPPASPWPLSHSQKSVRAEAANPPCHPRREGQRLRTARRGAQCSSLQPGLEEEAESQALRKPSFGFPDTVSFHLHNPPAHSLRPGAFLMGPCLSPRPPRSILAPSRTQLRSHLS